jgi:hypothetical protein
VNVVIGSAFRNMSGWPMVNYTRQIGQLQRFLRVRGHTLEWIAVEGDSMDNTRIELQRYAMQMDIPLRLNVREHGRPWFGSVESQDRMKALSFVGNGILELVRETDDVLVYVESDLIWNAGTVLQLIGDLQIPSVDVVAPLVFAGESFYDIWGFRGMDGERFSPAAPYHSSLAAGGVETLAEISSAGSCLVMKGAVARSCRIVNDAALVGFCQDVRDHDYHIFVNPTMRINHPC